MSAIIECIPNFSEGRNTDTLARLQSVAGGVSGVALLDVHTDADHNRSVYTLMGSPEGIAEAAFLLAETAVARIDLTRHSGEHPRMGAVDVIPFVPVRDYTLAECVALSKRVAERIYQSLGVPIFLYEAAAMRPERRNLADIRRGGFEGMPEKLLRKNWQPDYGTRQIHPTAGVTAVGARRPLIAFNVNLSTADVHIAKNIAKAVRGSSGGLVYCKALGIKLQSRDTAQVSMNMVHHKKTPLYRVFELIRAEAARYGVHITGSELVGLAPAEALVDCAAYYLQLENFDGKRQVLESHLLR